MEEVISISYYILFTVVSAVIIAIILRKKLGKSNQFWAIVDFAWIFLAIISVLLAISQWNVRQEEIVKKDSIIQVGILKGRIGYAIDGIKGHINSIGVADSYNNPDKYMNAQRKFNRLNTDFFRDDDLLDEFSYISYLNFSVVCKENYYEFAFDENAPATHRQTYFSEDDRPSESDLYGNSLSNFCYSVFLRDKIVKRINIAKDIESTFERYLWMIARYWGFILLLAGVLRLMKSISDLIGIRLKCRNGVEVLERDLGVPE